MELIDLVFNFVSSWITSNKPQSIGVGAVLLVVLILVNPKVAKQAGRAFSDLLKRIPIIGKPLEKKIEETQEAFNDGMKQDEANTFSPNMPTVDKEKLSKMIDETYPAPQINKTQQE